MVSPMAEQREILQVLETTLGCDNVPNYVKGNSVISRQSIAY